MWVVFEVVVAHTRMWAWCRTDGQAPGFTDIGFTEPDGLTPCDAPDRFELGAHLFTIPDRDAT